MLVRIQEEGYRLGVEPHRQACTSRCAGRARYSRPVRGDATLMRVARAIVSGDQARVLGLLAGAPELALACLARGATRHGAEEYFLDEIDHIVYAGDTALHIAAAAHEAGIARELVKAGASVAAANRRGAQPLHYAVDGIPGAARWNPDAQHDTVPERVTRVLVRRSDPPHAAAPTIFSDHLPTRTCPFAKTVSVRTPGGVDGESTPLVSECRLTS
jgi:hypothetical protein